VNVILWKIAGTLAFLALQAAAIVAVRRASHEQLVWMQFWRYRGDDLVPTLKKLGEELKNDPERLRAMATLNVVCCTLVLDALAALIWL
jgi:hypothetical protein